MKKVSEEKAKDKNDCMFSSKWLRKEGMEGGER